MKKYTTNDVLIWYEEYKKKPTLSHVAQMFGVSQKTISILFRKYSLVFGEKYREASEIYLLNMGLRKCSHCKQLKSIESFGRDKLNKYGLNRWCKLCTNKQSECYRNQNIEKVRITVNKSSKKWRKGNLSYVLVSGRKRQKLRRQNFKKLNQNIDPYDKNVEKKCYGVCKEILPAKNFSKNSGTKSGLNDMCKKCTRLYKQNIRKNNILYKIADHLRTRLRSALKGNYKSGSAVEDLGCTIEELKQMLEKDFYPNPKTGEKMTWDNYGKFGWHIDHIIPLSSFDLTNRFQLLEACHYGNLQPKWWFENLEKGSKI